MSNADHPQPTDHPRPRVSTQEELAELISAVLTAAAEVERTHTADVEELGAETTLMLSIADGLLDALTWAQEGLSADEPACMWLGALRWARAVDGVLPEGAPEPPLRSGAESFLAGGVPAGGDTQNIVGLRSAEMSLPHRPFNRPAESVPELASTDGPGVLARAISVGLLPYLATAQTRSLATSAAAFSHGSPEAHAACADAAVLITLGLHALGEDADADAFTQALDEAARYDGSADANDAVGGARWGVSLAASVALNSLGRDASRAQAADVGGALADEEQLQAGMLAAALIAAVTGESGSHRTYDSIENFAQDFAAVIS